MSQQKIGTVTYKQPHSPDLNIILSSLSDAQIAVMLRVVTLHDIRVIINRPAY